MVRTAIYWASEDYFSQGGCNMLINIINPNASREFFNQWLRSNYSINSIIHSGSEINITFQGSVLQSVQDDIITKYDSLTASDMTLDPIKSAIFSAMDFSKDLLADIGARLVVKGYDSAQVEQYFTDTGNLLNLLQSGALYTALTRLGAMTPTAVVPQEDLDFMKQRIENYLGI